MCINCIQFHHNLTSKYVFFLSPSGYPAAEFEQAMNDINEDINNIEIVFEETVGNNENNSAILNTPNSVESREQTPNSTDNGAVAQPARQLDVVRHPPPPMNCAKVPNVVLAGRMYEQKRKQRMAEIERKEREQRQFHAKKVPNFHSIHAARNARRAIEDIKITVPVTPRVVHNHRKNLERVRAKVSNFIEFYCSFQNLTTILNMKLIFVIHFHYQATRI